MHCSETWYLLCPAGGAHGSFLAALLRRHPSASGVLFDLPQVGRRFWSHSWQHRMPNVTMSEEVIAESRQHLYIGVLFHQLHQPNLPRISAKSL